MLKKIITSTLSGVCSLSILFAASSYGAIVGPTTYSAIPPLLSDTATPLVMIGLSNDHQVYFKAYTDYDDLDGDGLLDTTYKNSIKYEGYFDSNKCYYYDASASKLRFEPKYVTNDHYCTNASAEWSGNFLNWATMTRIDEIRKVLYGGYRSTDATNETVLERSFLPNDAHSFAKYYNGTDVDDLTPYNPTNKGLNQSDSGLTICNTTYQSSGQSAVSTNPPLMRIVYGNYSLWAAGERFQCRFKDDDDDSDGDFGELASAGQGKNGNDPDDAAGNFDVIGGNPLKAYGTSPTEADRVDAVVGDIVVRVKVCDDSIGPGGKSLIETNCKQYPQGKPKPTGMLQKFGDDGSVEYGLISGSYMKNKSGGVLRKQIGPMSDEINVSTDGTFKASVPSAGGIIHSINQFRLVSYDFNPGHYNKDVSGGSETCKFQRTLPFNNGECTNWGNPFSEIMLECYRYFSGNRSPGFDVADTARLSALTRQATWTNPLNTDNKCARLSVIAFNASASSFDTDELGGVSDLNTASSATDLTNVVGAGELTAGAEYFVGENGADNNRLCSSKTVTNLGDVKGTCPDAPSLQGSYAAAGLAHHAHISDINDSLDGVQNVDTYGVTLSPALPKVFLDVPGGSGNKVVILPACENVGKLITVDGDKVPDGIPKGNCALVDFKELIPPTESGGEVSGAFYVNWEDSEMGGDFDQDMMGILAYQLTSDELTVTTKVLGVSTSGLLGFGYVLSGTTDDGFHAQSGTRGYFGSHCAGTPCSKNDTLAVRTYDVGSSSATLLEQPLYYAAKWGGFTDTDGSGTPNLDSEWDSRNNNTGAIGADGIPDNYFLAINPAQLEAQLTAVMNSILARTASGTAAAVVANSSSGEGAVYQALYSPRVENADSSQYVQWVGSLHGLFIDKKGHLREDTDQDGKLDDYATDYIIDLFFDAPTEQTLVQKKTSSDNGGTTTNVGSAQELSAIKPIWEAQDELANLSDVTTQRSYTALASSGRYIFTGIDGKGGGANMPDGVVDKNEVVPFDAATFTPTPGNEYYRYLGLTSTNSALATNIVNYIRGEEQTGYRSRVFDVDGDGSDEVWRLGDIVHSSPVAVARPSDRYDHQYSDETYEAFRDHYTKRRQVVYVGGNDGMLHAFNAGFYDFDNLKYDTTDGGTAKAHPLGSELWAYVPFNLLPHLQWLTEPGYPHVYYVDGSPKAYDVNIFPADTDHPHGWGTILVVGMRFGGGEVEVDPNSDHNLQTDSDGDSSDNLTLRSGYAIFDVTNPEVAPVLLAEFSHEQLGYSVSEPYIVKRRAPDATSGSFASPAQNDWYLVFGSGPEGNQGLSDGLSSQSAKLFVYDLSLTGGVPNGFVSGFKPGTGGGEDDYDLNGHTASFVSSPTVADWNNDYQDDVIYFGTVGGTVDTPTGTLNRVVIPDDFNFAGLRSSSKVIDVADKPFGNRPLTEVDKAGDRWVVAGTGRFYVLRDSLSSQQQGMYGVKEPYDSSGFTYATVPLSSMTDTTGINVYTSKYITDSSGGNPVNFGGGVSAQNVAELISVIRDTGGWHYDFPFARARNVTPAAMSGLSVVYTVYAPSGEVCEPEGVSYLDAVHLQTGTAASFAALGVDDTVNYEDGDFALRYRSLGKGLASEPVIYNDIAIIQSSTGVLSGEALFGAPKAKGRQSWREISGWCFKGGKILAGGNCN